ncbi:hypothetical protein ACO0LB_14750 [Undibacterium sp. SXout7W]|uniref:hypothetical protein n=1 Tax=Undibacterium sp. SXout7W TaxID=3413049 RepID=UPI003BF43BDE
MMVHSHAFQIFLPPESSLAGVVTLNAAMTIKRKTLIRHQLMQAANTKTTKTSSSRRASSLRLHPVP